MANSSLSAVSDMQNFMTDPFGNQPKLKGPDFIKGFIIKEITGSLDEIVLNGNMMPHVPFTFGGGQRITKDFYAGHTEPVMQVLGATEDNVEIRGKFKDKTYSQNLVDEGESMAYEMHKLVESFRLKANLCQFTLGDWVRYGFIEKTSFEMKRLNEIDYRIELSIVGFTKPTNAKFVDDSKELPFDINSQLIATANYWQESFTDMPYSMPFSLLNVILGLVSAIATGLALITDFVNKVITSIENIKKAINRIKGLIKSVQNQLRRFKEYFGALVPSLVSALTTQDATPIGAEITNAQFYSSSIRGASELTALLQSLYKHFLNIIPTLPMARHLVKLGDTLQGLSVRYYGTPDNWKDIFDYNKLQDTVIATGALLEIPKV